MKHSLEEIIKELQREVAMRKQVYGKKVEYRQMTRQKADKQISLMEEAAEILENLQKNQPKQINLF